MTAHPAKTKAQRRALDAIGCGNSSPIMANATRDALLRAGLIEQCGEMRVFDEIGVFSCPEYEMPIPVHYQWCQHWSERGGPDE